jgi:hypothetical protein
MAKLPKTGLICALLAGMMLSACHEIPTAAWRNRTGPEALLDVSTELVHLDLASMEGIDQLIQWMNDDQPTRLELHCEPDSNACYQAESVAQQFAVPYDVFEGDAPRATLVYERVVARDCDNRYIDNPINPYNLPHPTFGCSMASNALQMVSDKRQLVSPALMDYQDAHKGAQAVRNYNQRPAGDASGALGTLVSR